MGAGRRGGGRLPRAGPGERRPRGAGVPGGPRPRAVGQRLVRGPSHARLQRALPAAGGAARPAAGGGAERGRGRLALRAPRPRPRRRARGLAVVRRRDGLDAHLGAADLRAGRRGRPRGGARRRARAHRLGLRAGRAGEPREPRGRRLRGAGRRGVVAGAPALVAGGARGVRASRPPPRWPSPSPRAAASRSWPRASGPRWRPRSPSAWSSRARRAWCASASRSTRSRSWRASCWRRRWAATSCASARSSRAPSSPPSCGARTAARSRCWRCRSSTGSGSPRSTTGRGPPATRPCTSATTTGCSRFLGAQRGGPFRIEIPFTDNHWESRWVAPHVPLARGWERQLDRQRNALFYDDRPITAARYRRWLDDNAVRFVALADAPIDYSAAREAALVRAGTAVPARGLARRALAGLRGRRRPAAGRRRGARDGHRVRARAPDGEPSRGGRPARALHAVLADRDRARLRRAGSRTAGRSCAWSAPGRSSWRRRSPWVGCARPRRDVRIEGEIALAGEPQTDCRFLLGVVSRPSGQPRGSLTCVYQCSWPAPVLSRRGSCPTVCSTWCVRCCSSPPRTTPTGWCAAGSTTRRAPRWPSPTLATSSTSSRRLGFFIEPSVQAWAVDQARDHRLRQLDLPQLPDLGDPRRARLPLPVPQQELLLRAQHVHGRHGHRARRLHRDARPRRRASSPSGASWTPSRTSPASATTRSWSTRSSTRTRRSRRCTSASR